MPKIQLRTVTWRRPLLAALLSLALAQTAGAHGPAGASEASSALSVLPVAVSVAAPVALFSAGALLTVVGVQASATGTEWVLERASDGARASVRIGSRAAVAVGTGVVVIALSTGWVLSAAGEALLFIPDAASAGLLHHEQVTR